MTAIAQRRNPDAGLLRRIAETSRQVHKSRMISIQSETEADAKLARLRKIRQARQDAVRRSAKLRRLANPIRLVLIGSFLFYLGLGGLYFVSVVRDIF
jgi:predicted oxidoreductase